MDKLTFEIPMLTVTVNGSYANAAKGRRKTAEYKHWEKMAGLQYLREKSKRSALNMPSFAYSGPVSVLYEISDTVSRKKRKGTQARDLGNHEKMLTDFLVTQGIIEDDRLVDEIIMRWVDDCNGIRVTVRPFV